MLSEITDFHTKRIFVNYLKQICQEIYKELSVYVNFQKNGICARREVKWNRNLENNKVEWNRFFDHLLSYVIDVPTIGNILSKKSEFVVSPHISKYSCSFYYDNKNIPLK